MPPCRTNLSCFKETCLASKQDILIVGKDCWAPTPTEKGFRWAGREKGGKLDDFTFDALIFFRVIEDPQPARSLHWDDEIKEGRLIYNDRFHIEPLCRVNHVAASTLPGNLAQVFDATVSNTSPVTTTLSDSQLDNLADLAGEDRWIQLYNLPPDPTVDCSLNFQNPVKIYWSGPNEQSHSSSNSLRLHRPQGPLGRSGPRRHCPLTLRPGVPSPLTPSGTVNQVRATPTGFRLRTCLHVARRFVLPGVCLAPPSDHRIRDPHPLLQPERSQLPHGSAGLL
jgi:hypothetical protein